MEQEPHILFEKRGALGLITLNRPKALNALTHGMCLGLAQTLPRWAQDDAIKAVAIRGAGERAFCAGGDIRAMYESNIAGTKAAVVYLPGCAPGDGVVCAALQSGLRVELNACDAIVLVLGTSAYANVPAAAEVNAALEGEGRDRTTVALAGKQGALLAAAVAADKPLAVVVASGGMVDFGDDVAGADALLAAPFGGQFAGDAIAAVVLGDENPAGRLTTTWYTTAALTALGSLTNYSMSGRTYRFIQPAAARFAFGHGLSFSTFEYSDLAVTPSAPGPCDALNVTVTLTNTAGPDGTEVAQLYTSFPGASVPQPRQALVNWEKLRLSAGGAVTVTLSITPEDNAVLRAGDFVPVIEPGARSLWLGASSDRGAAGLPGAFTISGPATPLASCSSSGAPPPGVAHVWPYPVLGSGGAARWAQR